uniref:Osteopetrosis-associated transmembrane protein 1 n=1 Tax=Petromyzon marinus TaxID=7757 RepID=A0AAJ7UC37_PETMA|nr:osteopetrosis-associated transmembrane protein 1 [Petromyzon marinus]
MATKGRLVPFLIPSLLLLLLLLPFLAFPAGAWGPGGSLPHAWLEPEMRGGGEVPLYPVYPVDPLGPTPDESPCAPLLVEFARRSAELALCSLRHARPLRLCGSCVIQQWSANRTYGMILTTVQVNNETCERTLLRSDRLQLVYQQHSFSQGLWDAASCEACLVNGTNGTREVASWMISFMQQLNKTRTCFHENSLVPRYDLEGNVKHSAVCNNCRTAYNTLGKMYAELQKNGSLCIDLEDAMNTTRQLWSVQFNCVEYCSDTPSVLAVSIFMCMLPIFFYMSSVIHSRQRKRRLVTSKRMKSTNSSASLHRAQAQ